MEIGSSKGLGQVNKTIAVLDERYISDNGAFIFTHQWRITPDRWRPVCLFYFEQHLRTCLVTNTAGTTDALEVPAAPMTFVDFPDEDGGWEDATPNQYALIPVTNTNVVLRLNLETWIVEHVWPEKRDVHTRKETNGLLLCFGVYPSFDKTR